MKVLVTGGTGFTGSHLVSRLLKRGHQVTVLDRENGIFFDELKARGARIASGSITEPKIVDDAVRDCEVVYHLAAAFRELKVSNKHYWNVNVTGTRNVARAALRCGVRRLIYCSTQGVHGHIKQIPGDENSPITPEDYYQYTKYEGEAVVSEYVKKGLEAVILRPTAIYGPGDPARFLLLFRMVKKGRFLMFGSGETCYHPVYISNLVDAFELASTSEIGVNGQTFIVGDDQYWTLNELVEHVADSMDLTVRIQHFPFWPLYGVAGVCEAVCRPLRVAPPLFRRRVNWFRQDRAFSIDKAHNDLGYQPRVGIKEGLIETAKWYRENHYI